MRTQISFLVELDQLATNRGLEHCVEVEVLVDVTHNDEQIQDTDVFRVYEGDKDIRTELSVEDMVQIDRVLSYELERF